METQNYLKKRTGHHPKEIKILALKMNRMHINNPVEVANAFNHYFIDFQPKKCY